MNKYFKILVPIFLFTVCTALQAQKRPNWEKIKALKVAFITERLELTPKEAQVFWPIYNDYETKKEGYYKTERFKIGADIKKLDELTDMEADNLLSRIKKLEEEKRLAQRDFIEKVSKTISAKKTILLMRSEEDFKRHLIKQYRQKNN